MGSKDERTGTVQDDSDVGEGFLDRWSRLKREARQEERPASDSPGDGAGPTAPAVGASGGEEDTAAGTPAVPELPPLESLGDDSDYSAFLAPGVHPDLRRAALRRLFRASKFNVVCPLDDNVRDFTKFTPLGDIVTADMQHRLLMRMERELAAAGEKGDAPVVASEEGDASSDTTGAGSDTTTEEDNDDTQSA